MRVCVFRSAKCVELEERPVPEVRDRFVLVKVGVCGICGSDVAAWQGIGGKGFPYSPGHEFCAVVAQTGRAVSGLEAGQRVVIDPNLGCGVCRFCTMGRPNLCDALKTRRIKSNGGLADYVALDGRMVYALPEGLPDELAPFVEPLSCALHMVDVADVKSAGLVAVFGAGSMGTLVGMALQSRGAEVFFIEPHETRRQRVSRLLGVRAMTPEELPGSELVGRVDAAIECSGSARAVAQAIALLRKGGRLVLGGLVGQAPGAGIPLGDITRKELEVCGSWLNPNTFGAAIDLALSSRKALSQIPAETFPLDDVGAAFARAMSADAPKVLVRP